MSTRTGCGQRSSAPKPGWLALLGLLLAACPGGSEKPWADRAVDRPGAADLPPLRDGALREGSASRESRGADGKTGEGSSSSCMPYCYPKGSPSQGWYDGCTKQLLKLPGTNYPYYDACEKCTAVCLTQPAKGWYSSCTNQLIKMGCD